MKTHDKISIDTLNDGEAIRIANGHIDEIVMNLQDGDTDPLKPRKLVLQVSFEPKKENPAYIEIKILGKAILAPKIGTGGIAVLGHNNGEMGLYQDAGVQGKIFDEDDRDIRIAK